MATTFEDLKRFMDESGLKYDTYEEHDVIAIGFGCDAKETTYRDADGDAHVQVIVRLTEQGELVAVFAPRAWNLAECVHRRAVCEAATLVQSQMKLIRLDLDADTWDMQPNIEIPLEQAPMCSQQLVRAIAGVLLVIRRYDPVFRHAMETGEVDFDLINEEEPPTPPADVTRILDLANDAGGLDALERLLGDSDAPAIEL
jgi:hypothetical protein